MCKPAIASALYCAVDLGDQERRQSSVMPDKLEDCSFDAGARRAVDQRAQAHCFAFDKFVFLQRQSFFDQLDGD